MHSRITLYEVKPTFFHRSRQTGADYLGQTFRTYILK